MKKIDKSVEDWRAQLSPEQFQVCRLGATERPFTGQYNDCDVSGTYHCICCDAALFESSSKFDAGCGWPSYSRPVTQAAVEELEDLSHGMRRVEVRCASCQAHLGHVFPDGPAPGGLRYCINSVALRLEPAR